MAKNVLVVAAHSDDEALGCAGTIAKHVALGDLVYVAFMTDGVSSRVTSGEEAVERAGAANMACDALGVSICESFDFPDNQMDSIPLLDVAKKVETLIDRYQPEIVYTHHVGDLNVDHQITHKAVLTACRPQPGFCVKEIYSFEVLSSTEWQSPSLVPFIPNVYVDITGYIGIKKQALEAYSEEMRQQPHSRSIENAIRLTKVRGNAIGVNNAEAFQLMRLLK